jgi:hypothetical protein
MRLSHSITRGAVDSFTRAGASPGKELQIAKASISASEYAEPTSHRESDSAASSRRTANATFR